MERFSVISAVIDELAMIFCLSIKTWLHINIPFLFGEQGFVVGCITGNCRFYDYSGITEC